MNDYITNAFTKEGENTNLEVNNLNVTCVTSKNNKFELDSEGNLAVKSLKTDALISDTLLNAMYPVGSIYISTNEKDPGFLFGGSWEQIKDKFLLACGNTYQNGSIGGEETHKLTTSEMPSHAHALIFHSHDGSGNSGKGVPFHGNGNAIIGGDISGCQKTGGNGAHNNMPPYLAVYMWKRIS